MIKDKYYEIFYKVFHLEFKNYHTQFFEGDENNTEKEKRIATAHAHYIPVLFGYPLTTLEITLKSCPPVGVFVQDIRFLNIKTFMFASSIPISPMKSAMVINVYHQPNFISKLVARIMYSAIPTGVISINSCIYLLFIL